MLNPAFRLGYFELGIFCRRQNIPIPIFIDRITCSQLLFLETFKHLAFRFPLPVYPYGLLFFFLLQMHAHCSQMIEFVFLKDSYIHS